MPTIFAKIDIREEVFGQSLEYYIGAFMVHVVAAKIFVHIRESGK